MSQSNKKFKTQKKNSTSTNHLFANLKKIKILLILKEN